MPEPTTAQKTATEAAPGKGGSLTLVAVLLAVFVVPTSISGTAVALPHIGADLDASPTTLQWVVNAFNLAFACFTLIWGSLADRIGRVKAFAAGSTIFAAGSVICAVAPNIYVLDGARALAGLGGGAIFACGSAIISTTFEGPRRAKAFALFGSVAGIGVAVGPTLSGPTVDFLGWRWIFGLQAILLVLVLVAVPVMKRGTEERVTGRLDIPGTVAFVAGMLALTYAIVQGPQWGWASPRTLGVALAAVLLLALFTYFSKRSDAPLLDLSLMGNKPYLAYSLVPVAASFGFVTMLTYLPTYLSEVTEASATAAGLSMLLLTLPVLVLPLVGTTLVEKGVRATTVVYASLACLVVGDLALLLLGPDTGIAVMALPMLITGAGMGLSAGLVDAQALAQVEPAKSGMAAGFLNTLRLGSEAIAVAVFGSLLAELSTDAIAGGNAAPAAYDGAFHTLLWSMAIVCAVIFLFIAVLARAAPRRADSGR
ncbi:MFS transporter [Glycomyces buryatensis]|uniref:MFS transporter n=1 Tax=Glycomyces buryatensis TaxID=2570927 RepID=UPI001B3C1768|nr:MFS transporter [Glycomyces buryatensis]